MADFLLEIGTEEMPSSAARQAVKDLERIFRQEFQANRLVFDEIRVYATPRRLAVLLTGLGERQKEAVLEIKGPPANQHFDLNGNITPAAKAFAEKHGVSPESLVEKETPKGSYIFAIKKEDGRKSFEVLKELIPSLIKKLSFKKTMRWQGKLRFIRPIRWLVALYDRQLIPFKLDGLESGTNSRGHRFLSPGELKIVEPSSYVELLRSAKVIVSQEERKKIILNGLREKAERGQALINPDLLDEVVYLVEYPWIVRCNFPEEYLSLPSVVIVEVLESHQRYFPWVDSNKKLLPGFFCVSNGSPESEKTIKEGNERVVKARLEDAKFYYHEDLKEPLASKVERLRGVVFQEKLGNLWEKTERVEKISEYLAEKFNVDEEEFFSLKRAAQLAKADLTTEMVKEFPELQGVIGKEYALKSGEPFEVAEAIYEHYLPRFPSDTLPKTKIGKIISIADKVDTVVGYFLAGFPPTGSEDPYSLRRQAQGVIRIVFDGRIDLSLVDLIKKSLSLYSEQLGIQADNSIFESLCDFFKARVERIWQKAGYGYLSVRSLLSRSLTHPVMANSLIFQLEKAQKESWWNDLLIAYYRPKNLSSPALGVEVDPLLFSEKEEKLLYEAVMEAERKISDLIGKSEWRSAMLVLANLRKVVDCFFDAVLVMSDDIKLQENRLRLLNLTVDLFEKIADFSVFPKVL